MLSAQLKFLECVKIYVYGLILEPNILFFPRHVGHCKEKANDEDNLKKFVGQVGLISVYSSNQCMIFIIDEA